MQIQTKIGAHVSVAGGIDKAPERAADLGCETFQCFTRPPQGGPAPKLTLELIKNFKSEMAKFGMETFHIHTPYYLNFASLEPRVRESSIRVVREELERGSLLGARYIMTHLGSHTGQTAEEGVEKVRNAIVKILDGYSGSTKFLIEISAGAGNVIGDTFGEIGTIISEIKNMPGFGGICFDTCHAFGAGYDFRTPKKAKEVLKEFDKNIGLKYLKLTHVNDSKVDLGGKRDRHEHIGQGFIGDEGIKSILQTPEFLDIDWLLETEDNGREIDVKKLKQIRAQKTK